MTKRRAFSNAATVLAEQVEAFIESLGGNDAVKKSEIRSRLMKILQLKAQLEQARFNAPLHRLQAERDALETQLKDEKWTLAVSSILGVL